MMTDLRSKNYEDRLRALHLTTLETRRIRGDLLGTFKIMKCLENVDYKRLFSLSGCVLRANSMKLFKPTCRSNLRKDIFSNKVMDRRNDFAQDLIDTYYR